MEKRFIGVTRFSVVATKNSGFRISSANRESYLEELFSENRLRPRVAIFEHLSLPSLKNFARKHDYTHVLQVSPQLPQKWRDKLDQLAQDNPFLRIIEVGDESMTDSVREVVRSWGRDFEGLFTWFRLDDDDFLSFDYLDEVEYLTTEHHIGCALSFGRVLSACHMEGAFTNVHKVLSPHIAIGQAFVCYSNNRKGVMVCHDQVPHHIVNQYHPTIVNDLVPFGFWTRHPSQDSHAGPRKIGALLSNLQADLAQHPFADNAEIADRFPQLWTAIHDQAASTPNDKLKKNVILRNSEWINNPLSDWPEHGERIVKCKYKIDFNGKPHSGTTLQLSFTDREIVEGQFPRDEGRGDYRRLFVDSEGKGTIILPLVPANLRQIRLQPDNGTSQFSCAQVEFTPLD